MRKNGLIRKIFTALFAGVAIAMVASCNEPKNDDEKIISEDKGDDYKDALPSNTKDGTILQAFNWTYNQILENLDSIANAGFKTIQTSPVQQPKSGGASWWAFYQPLSFSIADNSPLGTKADLKKLCDEAEKKNISIIADIVFNHLANISDTELESDGTPKVSPEVEKYEPEIYALRNASGQEATFHHNPHAQGSGAITQVYSYGGLPDLNTANPLVQQRSLDLLKECIDVGIDGFRFDAAKHIETPTDPEYSSDFWPNVLGVAKTYYKEKTGNDLYAYGEILNSPDGGRDISCYTSLMDVTDDGYIANVFRGATLKKGDVMASANYSKTSSASNLVTWVDSHDSFDGNYPQNYEARLYAVLASRKDSRPMYLARPDKNTKQVATVANYFFEGEVIAVSNRFHNEFVGANENLHGENSVFVNERYNDEKCGAIIVDTAHQEEIDVTFTNLKDGVYYDQLTGRGYVIRNGKAHLKLDQSGICVLTRSKNDARPRFEISQRGGNFLKEIKVNVKVDYAKTSTYKLNNGSPITFEKEVTITINQTESVELKFELKNESFTVEKTYTFTPVKLIEGYFNVVNLNPTYLTDYEIYIWSWSQGKNGKWSKDYTISNGVMLIDKNVGTNCLIALLPKGYEIKNMNSWDSNVIKQSNDLVIANEYFDAKTF